MHWEPVQCRQILTAVLQERNVLLESFGGPSDGSGAGAGAIVPIEGGLDFHNVKFAFPSRPDRDIYKDMTLNVESKRSIGLVGRSGSGKR